MEGETLTFITTLGTARTVTALAATLPRRSARLNTTADDDGTGGTSTSWVTATVDADQAAGARGTATITVTHGSLDPASVDVTMSTVMPRT